tara:strand:- start:91 stop:795 length:705 start_codon:yes stop_codon:yes gene_type:complete
MINNYQISVIIPCYNEISTIEKIVEKVKKNIQDQDEIIIVDDFSSDGSREFLEKYKLEKNITVYFNEMNMGKGYSIRRGIDKSKGNIIIIQDADLEYDPADYQKLLLPFLETDADIVYGSRFIGGSKYVRTHFFWHYIANKILTFMCNLVSNLNLTDMETGYKVFKSSCVKQLSLKENTFGIEPELTIKFAKKKFKFFEVPISYNGRSYHEGKKITLKDAFIAVYCIVKYSFKD